MSRCGTCHARIAEPERPSACPSCRQEYHEACWTELGGCGTYGCDHAVAGSKPAVTAVQAGWGDSKPCPACSATLHPSALTCRCGANFPTADPMTRLEYAGWSRRLRRQSVLRWALAVLFILSLLGPPALILGPTAGVLALVNRKHLAGLDGTYLAMGYGAAAIGLTHAMSVSLIFLGYR